MARWALLLALAGSGAGKENGLARRPPMGWRSWNLYGANVDQQLIEGIMEGMVSKKRSVDGQPTSLCDLGYCDVGLDDNWQDCKAGTGGVNFHDAQGNPVVNLQRFPDLKAMTDKAHSLGLTAGWYGNNCICMELQTSDKKYYEGDVRALRKFGFDSWKLDGCGVQTDLQLYDTLIDADGGKPVMVENCHWGVIPPSEPNRTWCPWNMYRTSGDVRAKYSSVVGNLLSVASYSQRNLSYPGCWAYPDMLELGCTHGPGGAADPGLSDVEARAHFSAWVIVSSPLTLSHDVNNDTVMDKIWPLISNKEAIAVSQTYAGYSGGPFKSADSTVVLDSVRYDLLHYPMTMADLEKLGPQVVPSWQYYYKPLNLAGSKVAVLLMNHGETSTDLTLSFADVPGLACSDCHIRDIWKRSDLGMFKGQFKANLGSHDCAFLILSKPETELVLYS